jgi:type IV pilus assembly protein PilM
MNSYRQPIGLELTDASVKVARIAMKGKRARVINLNQAYLPQGLVSQGEILDPVGLSSFVRAFFARQRPRIRTKFVNLCIPEAKTFVGNFHLADMSAEEMKEAMRWEVERYIPMSSADVFIDWQVTSSSGNRKHLMFGASDRASVDSYAALSRKIGLIPVAFELEAVATLRSLFTEEQLGQMSKPVLIVDIGARRTCFIVYANRTILFNTSIPLSGDVFTAAMAKAQRISFAEADAKKRQLVGEITPDVCKTSLKGMCTLIDDLARQIRSTLSYFHEHFSEYPSIKHVVLCGGSARLSGLVPYLAAPLKQLNIDIGNAGVRIQQDSGKHPYQYLGYEKVIGLALRGYYHNDLD